MGNHDEHQGGTRPGTLQDQGTVRGTVRPDRAPEHDAISAAINAYVGPGQDKHERRFRLQRWLNAAAAALAHAPPDAAQAPVETPRLLEIVEGVDINGTYDADAAQAQEDELRSMAAELVERRQRDASSAEQAYARGAGPGVTAGGFALTFESMPRGYDEPMVAVTDASVVVGSISATMRHGNVELATTHAGGLVRHGGVVIEGADVADAIEALRQVLAHCGVASVQQIASALAVPAELLHGSQSENSARISRLATSDGTPAFRISPPGCACAECVVQRARLAAFMDVRLGVPLAPADPCAVCGSAAGRPCAVGCSEAPAAGIVDRLAVQTGVAVAPGESDTAARARALSGLRCPCGGQQFTVEEHAGGVIAARCNLCGSVGRSGRWTMPGYLAGRVRATLACWSDEERNAARAVLLGRGHPGTASEMVRQRARIRELEGTIRSFARPELLGAVVVDALYDVLEKGDGQPAEAADDLDEQEALDVARAEIGRLKTRIAELESLTSRVVDVSCKKIVTATLDGVTVMARITDEHAAAVIRASADPTAGMSVGYRVDPVAIRREATAALEALKTSGTGVAPPVLTVTTREEARALFGRGSWLAEHAPLPFRSAAHLRHTLTGPAVVRVEDGAGLEALARVAPPSAGAVPVLDGRGTRKDTGLQDVIADCPPSSLVTIRELTLIDESPGISIGFTINREALAALASTPAAIASLRRRTHDHLGSCACGHASSDHNEQGWCVAAGCGCDRLRPVAPVDACAHVSAFACQGCRGLFCMACEERVPPRDEIKTDVRWCANCPVRWPA